MQFNYTPSHGIQMVASENSHMRWCQKAAETVWQGSTPTFQLKASQVASDLDVTTISVYLLDKLAGRNRKPLTKTEFLLVCG